LSYFFLVIYLLNILGHQKILMRYLIIPASRVPEVKFGQVREDGPAYLRYNNDNSKTFIKWNTEEDPDCVNDIISAAGEYWGPYEREQFMSIMTTEEWVDNSNPGD
jgi:hypothetical protein